MRYTYLGNTGLKVSELCLGAMTFGAPGWGADEAESRRVFHAFVDAGGNFIDTANAYSGGNSETLVGSFVRGRRDRFVIATKYTVGTDPEDINAWGNGRKNLTRALDASLARLGTDHIDLFFPHMWDGFTPVEEVVRALEDAVRAGKVLHTGFSDFPAWLVARADALAEVQRLTRPAAIQIEYNLAQREAERELLPFADALGLSVLDWSPLGGGVLSGKLLSGDKDNRVAVGVIGHFDKYRTARVAEIAGVVVETARDLGCTPSQLAIAWLRARSPAHIPIVGARTAAHIVDNLKAVNLSLSDGVMQRLDAASAIDLGFPSDFHQHGWSRWFGVWPTRLDPRIRHQGRNALALDGCPSVTE
jgi:aryl-alcohol dehydrogenase-like predicted oxidoreductase